MTQPHLTIISNGWGVQSMTVLAMVALGDLPPIDAAIHSDTLHERSTTYAYAKRWTPWLTAHNVACITAQNTTPQIIVEARRGGKIWIPAFTHDADHDVQGQLRRQCTQRWKVAPLRQWLQTNRHKRPVEQWLNISMDEWQRAKDSDVKYITNRFPLLEKKMTRQDCVNYLNRHGIEVPSKSACVFCPFHNMNAWREMKAEDGPDWAEAVRVDEMIRKIRPPYDLFLHRRNIPLAEVDLRTPADHGQLALWQEVCDSGYCWT